MSIAMRVSKKRAAGTITAIGALAVLTGGPVAQGALSNGAGIGVLGDSYSNEYSETFRADHRNWVEQLAAADENGNARDDNGTGAYGAFPGLNFGLWDNWDARNPSIDPNDEPRNTGFQFNWAQGGAETYEATRDSGGMDDIGVGRDNEDDQLWGVDGESGAVVPGLAGQVRNGEVKAAVVGIGLNDFGDGLDEIAQGTGDDVAGDGFNNEAEETIHVLEQNVELIVNTLEEAGQATGSRPDIVLMNVPDWNAMPTTRAGGYSAQERERISDATREANDRIAEIAADRNIPVIDMFRLMNFGDADGDGGEPFDFAGIDVTNDSSSPTADTFPFWADSAHPGTVVQGMMANSVLTALHDFYGHSVDDLLLSDAEILETAYEQMGMASMTPQVETPRFNAMSDFRSFVIPEPGTIVLSMAGFAMIAARGRRSNRRNIR